MKLLFKQRMFSWFCSYDIYDENGDTVYSVIGKPSWGHLLKIYDNAGKEIGYIKEKIFSFLPKYEIFMDDNYTGCIVKEMTFFKPRFRIDYMGWRVQGNIMQWDYTILNEVSESVATIHKEIFNWTDTYTIEVFNPRDALHTLMLVLAIDAEKCSNN